MIDLHMRGGLIWPLATGWGKGGRDRWPCQISKSKNMCYITIPRSFTGHYNCANSESAPRNKSVCPLPSLTMNGRLWQSGLMRFRAFVCISLFLCSFDWIVSWNNKKLMSNNSIYFINNNWTKPRRLSIIGWSPTGPTVTSTRLEWTSFLWKTRTLSTNIHCTKVIIIII